MHSRRDFLLRTGATGYLLAAAATRVGAESKPTTATSGPLKILILGGTGNIGPSFVRTAVARGHRVSVFSRGKRAGAELPEDVEHLIGDRESNLDSIKNRDWDAVLDLATFDPEWVRILGEAMKHRVGHYLFISTVSVYDHPERNRVTDETAAVIETIQTPAHKHGANKVFSEREAKRQFPSRTLILRPGYIAGPEDRVGFLTYWPLRFLRGGEALVPGTASLPFQCIDVRDLAELALRAIENRATGTFNAVGPASTTTLGEMIRAARAAVAHPADPIWIPLDDVKALQEKDIRAKTLFFPAAPIMRMSNARALELGFTPRPLAVTLADTMDWYFRQPATARVEFAPGYEKNHESKAPAPTSADQLWDSYLQKEQAVIQAVRKRQA